MTCEWPRNSYSKGLKYCSQPQIDLLPLSAKDIEKSVHTMDELVKQGAVYIHCKLGYSRSATVAVAWLVHHGDAKNIEGAVALVEQTRPQVILNTATIEQLNYWYTHYHLNRVKNANTLMNKQQGEVITILTHSWRYFAVGSVLALFCQLSLFLGSNYPKYILFVNVIIFIICQYYIYRLWLDNHFFKIIYTHNETEHFDNALNFYFKPNQTSYDAAKVVWD